MKVTNTERGQCVSYWHPEYHPRLAVVGTYGDLEVRAGTIIGSFGACFLRRSTLEAKVGPLTPGDERTLLEGSMAKLRHGVGIEAYPADEVLGVLCSSAASDGKLTR